MRADRLVAILMLLQTRKQVTAAEVAEELEVSERTARRDLEALGMAGLPIYPTRGRNGGWQLVGGNKTDLSGLTAAEAQALFLVAGPSSSATPEVKAALRKLVRALPEPFRPAAEAARSAVVVDPQGWGSRSGFEVRTPTHLEAVQRAVVEGEQLVMGYVARDRTPTTRTVHPLGLASKGQIWYLVADTENGLRTFRVDRITSVAGTGEAVVRPPGFDLAEAWDMIADEVDRKRAPVWATGTAAAEAIQLLRWMFGTRVRIGPPTEDGRVLVEVGGPDAAILARELAGLGHMVHITEPAEVRATLAAVGAELVASYGAG